MRNKKIRILCDKTLGLELLFVGIPLFIPMCVFLIVVFVKELAAFKSPPVDIVIISLFLTVTLFCLVMFICYIIPRFLVFVELDSEGVCLNKIYKKTPKIPYKKLWNFKLAYYSHMWSIRYFIVIGCEELTQEQLTHINLVPNSEHLVKIQLTKRNYYRLREILPSEQKEKLINLYSEDSSEERSDAFLYYKRIEAKKKQKRRALQRKKKNKKR